MRALHIQSDGGVRRSTFAAVLSWLVIALLSLAAPVFEAPALVLR
jgi:hypothetical protein